MFLELVDLRQASRHVESMEIVCDPRVRLVIPAGVAYRMRADGRYLLRFESEILLDENEPRIDLPQIGGDCLLASEEDLLKMPIFVPPKIFCPEEAIWLLVDSEAQNNV